MVEQKESLVVRPHHLEGALHSVIAAINAPQYAGITETMDPEEVLAMTYAAEDLLMGSTPPEVRAEITEKYQSDERFQKIVEFVRRMQERNPEADSLIPKSEMYRALKQAYDKDSDATVVFRNTYDFFCQSCPNHPDNNSDGKHCMTNIRSALGDLEMDDTVIQMQGSWEYNQPYKIREVLDWLLVQGTRRKITMLTAWQHDQPEEKASWKQDIEFSDKKPGLLAHFEKVWRNKDTKAVLGEYVHMALVSEEYSDYYSKAEDTVNPEQYQHAFESYLEFATDRKTILQKILTESGIKFTDDGNIDMEALDDELRAFVSAQYERNNTDPDLIMNSPLKEVADQDFGQSQHLYELLPQVSNMPAMKKVVERLDGKFGQDFFLFLGTINDMKIGDDKFFVFDVDFCTNTPSDSFDSYAHEEFRRFNYPFWISTSITNGKFNILVRTLQGDEDLELLNETYDLDAFPNYGAALEYTAQQILDRDLVDQIPTTSNK
ncbi:hypothetical protein GF340_05030 [Candidatus Peregrinibacteria bacterium]|nr:hypothetical protein [Candidatus Peregrinibacteria bacterium]